MSTQLIQEETLATKVFFMCCILGWLTLTGILVIVPSHTIFQFINTHHTPFLDTIIPWITMIGEFWIVLPILLGFLFNKRFRTLRGFLALAICNLLPFGITHVLKQWFQAHRPMYYFEHAAWHHYVEGQPKQYHFSFPSGHTEGAFALLTFLVLMLPGKKWHFAILLYLLGILVGYSRIYLSQHFLEDIVAGSIIGVVFCYLPFKIIQPFRVSA